MTYNKFKAYWNKHLVTPNINISVKIRNVEFFDNHFRYNNKQYNYTQILGIQSKVYKKYQNEIPTSVQCDLHLILDDNVTINLSNESILYFFNRRPTEVTMLMSDWLHKKTFKNRLLKALEEIKNTSIYTYWKGISVSNEGDVFYNKIFVANISSSIKSSKKNFIYGVGYSNIFGSNIGQNPYYFKIRKQNNDNSILRKNFLTMEIVYNKDIFDKIITKIINDCRVY